MTRLWSWHRASAAAVTLLLLGFTSSCEQIPRDPNGTLARVAAEGSFRVGVISSGPDATDTGPYDAFLKDVALQTRAQPRLMEGSTERLLSALEDGEVDVVIGEISAESPWRTRVTILPPLHGRRSDDAPIELTVAARNGENAWIATLFEATTRTSLQEREQ